MFPLHYWNSGDCLLIQFKSDRGNLSHCFIVSLYILKCLCKWLPSQLSGKESTYNAGDPGSIPGSGRSTGKGIGHPLQYSGLENSMDCAVHGVTKSRTQLSNFHSLTNKRSRIQKLGIASQMLRAELIWQTLLFGPAWWVFSPLAVTLNIFSHFKNATGSIISCCLH